MEKDEMDTPSISKTSKSKTEKQKRRLVVPVQPYAGRRLVVHRLVVPDHTDDLKPSSEFGQLKPVSGPKFMDMARPSFLERKWIERTLYTVCSMENLSTVVNSQVVDGMLAALETYLKYIIKTVIELCVHRSNNRLFDDARFDVDHGMRFTMRFLDDREVDDYGGSDDECEFGHRRRYIKLQRNRSSSNTHEIEMRLESTNKTALLALGVKKPTLSAFTSNLPSAAAGASAVGAGLVRLPKRQFSVCIKQVKLKDIIHFMENKQRYKKSKLLYDAYLNY